MACDVPLATERIVFRRVRLDDLERFDALDRDDDVLRFIDWSPPTRDEHWRAIETYLDEYERWPGFGRFVAESPTGEFLGWFALRVADDPRVPDLGYRLHRRLWGRGLASEGGRALIDYAFRQRAADAVEADTMSVNAASRRVMEKCGMTYVRTFHVHFDDPLPGAERGEVLYRITRAEWASRRDAPVD